MRTPGTDLTLHKLEVFRLTAELESVSLAAERLRTCSTCRQRTHPFTRTQTRRGKIIMSQPSPLSALCAANEVAVAIEAGPRVNPF